MSRDAKDLRGSRRESERRLRGRETYREGATDMYLSEKHDGSAARTAGAIAFSSLSIKLSTLEKRHRLHALTVAPILSRSAYGFTDTWVGSWSSRRTRREMLRQNMPLTQTKMRYS
jgi:hypothetical protein